MKASGEKKIGSLMVTDTGGVNDQSLTRSAWEGMTELKDKNGWDVSYLESKRIPITQPTFDKAVDAESDLFGALLIWQTQF